LGPRWWSGRSPTTPVRFNWKSQ